MAEAAAVLGQVVKLDRGFPLVKLEGGQLLRCEHATAVVRENKMRATIGDFVEVAHANKNDMGIISAIRPRKTKLVRKDPVDGTRIQVLAANFNNIAVVHELQSLNTRRLERELVIAHASGAQVLVVLTKADTAPSKAKAAKTVARVKLLVAAGVQVFATSTKTGEGINELRRAMPPSTVTVLVGKSGAGKSSLINQLVGKNVQDTGNVREGDGRGRHTTVSREMVAIPNAGFVVDMPGIRGLGLLGAEGGLYAAFADVYELASGCKFRNCTHKAEPGCAVRAAVSAGKLAPERLTSFQMLAAEAKKHEKELKDTGHMKRKRGSK